MAALAGSGSGARSRATPVSAPAITPAKARRKRCEAPEGSEWQRDRFGKTFFDAQGQPHIIARVKAAHEELPLLGPKSVPFGNADLRALEGLKHSVNTGVFNNIVKAVDLLERGYPKEAIKKTLSSACVTLKCKMITVERVNNRMRRHFRKQDRQKAAAEDSAAPAPGHEDRSSKKRKLRPKSKKMQDAGKNKAHALQPWKAELAAARAALRADGYTGTLSFKKGLPLHNKILELRGVPRRRVAVKAAPAPRGP